MRARKHLCSLGVLIAALASPGALAGCASVPAGADAGPVAARQQADEVIYFILPDRFDNGDPANDTGGLAGDRMVTGFDPTDTGFYQGGDLAGVTRRLDYIQGLGATAIWLGPVFRNQPVQVGRNGFASAGYHGYWVLDFTEVDPHFGTREQLRGLVAEAHRRGMRVYLDIITNHMANVIGYAECPDGGCPYRDAASFPVSRRGGLGGPPINDGFARADGPDWARLTDPRWAYTPVVPPELAQAKTPSWLNDPLLYHNRGDTHWRGESSQQGDFAGLDDLNTAHPQVIAGMIDIYGDWIEDLRIDGFRIDTARHVDSAFWQAFVPGIMARARAAGINDFRVFGEYASGPPGDPVVQARGTRVDGMPAALDFAFAFAAADIAAGVGGPDRLDQVLWFDALQAGGEASATSIPTFLGNHDNGRFAWLVRQRSGHIGADELMQRAALGHALMFLARGTPVIHGGDEQGFVGSGNDKAARAPQFPARAASYLADDILGTEATHASAHFDPSHPLYRTIAGLARLRTDNEALRRGRMIMRTSGEAPGLIVFSRIGADGREVLVAVNPTRNRLDSAVTVEAGSVRWNALAGSCPAASAAPGSVVVAVPPLDWVVCAATRE
jgi:glycosidase